MSYPICTQRTSISVMDPNGPLRNLSPSFPVHPVLPPDVHRRISLRNLSALVRRQRHVQPVGIQRPTAAAAAATAAVTAPAPALERTQHHSRRRCSREPLAALSPLGPGTTCRYAPGHPTRRRHRATAEGAGPPAAAAAGAAVVAAAAAAARTDQHRTQVQVLHRLCVMSTGPSQGVRRVGAAAQGGRTPRVRVGARGAAS